MLDLEAIKRRAAIAEAATHRHPLWSDIEEALGKSAADVPALVAKLEKALKMLNDLEWAGPQDSCPSCQAPALHFFSNQPSKHRPDCELKALLGET